MQLRLSKRTAILAFLPCLLACPKTPPLPENDTSTASAAATPRPEDVAKPKEPDTRQTTGFLAQEQDKQPIVGEESANDARFRSNYLRISDITDDPQVAALIESLEDEGKGKKALETIKPQKKEYIPVLRKALWHSKANVRANVAKILLLLDDESDETSKALTDLLLHDADEDVRSIVARVLVTYRSKDTVPALIEVLRSDPYVHARANAAWALRQIRDPRAVPALIYALDDKETWVRLRAVGGLKELKAKQALPKLRAMTDDPNQEVRKEVHEAISAMSKR